MSFGWADIPPLAASLEEDERYFYEFERCLQAGFFQGQRPVEYLDGHKSCSPTNCDTDESHQRRSSNKREGKSVSFSDLEIREHSIIIGDHPFSSSLPVSLGWEHSQETTIIDIETYEQGHAAYRRHGSDIRMSYFERKNRLKTIGGFSESAILKAEHLLSRQKQINYMRASADV
eukprot:CAMPEP_0113578294 /NCGR_PEP_ID=MMETSP0015_2-20120614/29393_1 /TAXON_ID=2838 /ORGANISM="Odontella" /LENGTH=174 /DNA_ID=CAMNT_0000482067 /DNA_START=215 /DNA_END=739 /DNA_ORIENTATION=- /assembly_acc=CAM_ASM_000160